MIVGVGTDLVEMERIRMACGKETFLNRIFTKEERKLIQKDFKKAAGNFAVKEAVVKVFGTGFGQVAPIEIETLRDEAGKPYVILHGQAKHVALELGITHIHVSITNTKEYASAFAIGEHQEERS